MDAYASSACVSASMPEAAGQAAAAGSSCCPHRRSPCSAAAHSRPAGTWCPSPSSVMTANGVTSEPVPDEVGIATKYAFSPIFGKVYTRLRMSMKRIAKVQEVDVRVLVHHPHDLARVHRGTAAQRDDAVRLEGSHRLGALFGAGEGRVGSNVIESRCAGCPSGPASPRSV